ncbi:hypothetical protein OG563_07410 [Nocardia vinacea]|uniref:Uncharacterized protein n=1 Tax=Nocardia vinacea TaxID=96468 RepID=A0ABZ1YXZ2_9NOCA|nr:hypothetical protein [Nocardia vinacea]
MRGSEIWVTPLDFAGSGEENGNGGKVSHRMTGQRDQDPDDQPQAPDVAFTLAGSGEQLPDDGVEQHGDEVADTADASDIALSEEDSPDVVARIVAELTAVAPPAWRRLHAEFAITVETEAAQAAFSVDDTEISVVVSKQVLDSVRAHREAAADQGTEPWWRLLLHVTAGGEIDIEHDYGERPFPEGQLFAPEAYRADLDRYPRGRLPVWLAAYVGHGGRQVRGPRQAAAAVRADRAAGVWSELTENELPAFPVMWARWAAIASAFVAVGSEWGPRIMPSLAWFESSRRSGSTLCALPGGRAVLSGGVWNASALDATYNDSADMPNFFAGAPEWVADQVLNPRAESGLLSFCYWWDAGRWYRGESPSAEECAPAIPGVWSADTVSDIIARLVAAQPSGEQQAAARNLVAAADVGVVTRDSVANLFADNGINDIDGALFQLGMAGLVTEVADPMPKELAVTRIRQYVLGRGLDTTGYPLDELVADRLSCGWMVYVPVSSGEIAIGRAIFYIADDGVLEPSSSSVPPTKFVAGFEQRFQQRRRSGV